MDDNLEIPDFLRRRPTGRPLPVIDSRRATFADERAPDDTPEWFTGNRSSLPKTMDAEAWEALREQTEIARERLERRIDKLRMSKGLDPRYGDAP